MNVICAVTPQVAFVPADVLLSWGVLGPVLLVAWLSRRRLPAGVDAGLFVGSLSGLLLAPCAHSADPGESGWLFGWGTMLAGLTLLWQLGGRWGEPPVPADADQATRARRATRERLQQQVAAVAGLLTGAVVLAARQQHTGPIDPRFLVLLLPVLFVAGVNRCVQRGGVGLYGLLAVSLLLLWEVAPQRWISTHGNLLAGVALLVALAALLAELLIIISDWRTRRRIWAERPHDLPRPALPHRAFHQVLLVAATLVGIAGVLLGSHGLMPAALGGAALSTLIIGHRRISDRTGELGLLLLLGAVVSAGSAWIGQRYAGTVVGWLVAALWLTWLARFWEQQLLDGRPWTTAGRLIPVARRLGLVATAGALVWLAAALLSGSLADVGSGASVAIGLLALLLWSVHCRESRSAGGSTAALGAILALGVVLLASAVFSSLHPFQWGDTRLVLTPAVLVGLGALLLALRVGPARGTRPEETVFNAWLAGLLPIAVLLLLLWRGTWRHEPGGAGRGSGGLAAGADISLGRARSAHALSGSTRQTGGIAVN